MPVILGAGLSLSQLSSFWVPPQYSFLSIPQPKKPVCKKATTSVQLLEHSAAEEAGLQEGDVIVQLGDQPIGNTGDMSEFLLEHLPGETVTAVYFRGSTKITTEIALTDRGPDYGGF